MKQSSLELSLVIPCRNEEESLEPLLNSCISVADHLQKPYEIIITDDGSTDRSWEVLKRLALKHEQIRIQRFASNRGKSAALWAGFQIARGELIATLDSDLQNDPKDLPKLLDALKTFDCACGTRVGSRRKADSLGRHIYSLVTNKIRNIITNESINDSGCPYRAFRRVCIENMKFYEGMHRFFPTLVKMEGFSVIEIPISHYPRIYGKSHFGIRNRIFTSLIDLLAIRWMQNRKIHYKIDEKIN